MRRCPVRLARWLKALPRSAHANGLSPVCGWRGVPAEASPALAAREGLVRGVRALMLRQLGPLREGLPALPAHARLLAARGSPGALPGGVPRGTPVGAPPFWNSWLGGSGLMLCRGPSWRPLGLSRPGAPEAAPSQPFQGQPGGRSCGHGFLWAVPVRPGFQI